MPKLSDEDRQRGTALLDANKELVEAFAAHCGFKMWSCPKMGMLIHQCYANNDAIDGKSAELIELSKKLLSFNIVSSVHQGTMRSIPGETYTSGFRDTMHMSPSYETPARRQDQFHFAISPMQPNLFANMRRAMGAEAAALNGGLPATTAQSFPVHP